MDPISIFLIGLAMAGTGILARDALKPIVITTKDKIIASYRGNFENKDVLILGGASSGKTSLILLLTEGRPYLRGSNNQRQEPNPTMGVVVLDKRVLDTLDVETMNKLERIQKDVAGERKELWEELVREINPHGIIYMIDGRRTLNEIQGDLADLFNHVLTQYPTSRKKLRALHIFLNHADGFEGRVEGLNKQTKIVTLLESHFHASTQKHLRDVKWNVSLTQLSPQKDKWREAEHALERFGSDLR
jgi:hypothetical protein